MINEPDVLLQEDNIRMVPLLHGRMEFALEVRKAFQEFQPDHVAVEYPGTLRDAILAGVQRLPFLSVVHYEEKGGTFVYLLLEPTDGQVEAIRLALQKGIPIHFIDRDTEGYPNRFGPFPDSYAISRIGYPAYCKAFWKTSQGLAPSQEDTLRERTMAFHLQNLRKTGEKVLFVGGMAHWPRLMGMLNQPQTRVIGLARRQGVGLAHLHEESSREVLTEMPFLCAAYERFREGEDGLEITDLDRLRVNQRLLEMARETHRQKSKEDLTPGQMRILYRFVRNYALLTGNLSPSFYQLIVGARGAADDNFAYEVWEKGSDYPYQTDAPGLQVLRLKGEDLYLDQRKIRFHKRLKTMRRRLVPVPVKKKGREPRPGEWQRQFKGDAICSYPPEDVAVEGYGHYLQKKALEIKTEENVRIEPFASSLLDGLDLRQTLREWHTGKIYVREGRPLKGKVGSVVVIFDADFPDEEGREAFPWRVTWLGEHDQESDMAFYSTEAGEVMDGPGISRCTYGGFVLSYPPLRMYDIWRDPFFERARNKPERLLMAGLDYSLENMVVYVASTAPSGWCQSMAARLGKRILYLPIGSFSPVTLKKIRQFHVLDGHPVRRYAHHYIG